MVKSDDIKQKQAPFAFFLLYSTNTVPMCQHSQERAFSHNPNKAHNMAEEAWLQLGTLNYLAFASNGPSDI